MWIGLVDLGGATFSSTKVSASIFFFLFFFFAIGGLLCVCVCRYTYPNVCVCIYMCTHACFGLSLVAAINKLGGSIL